MAVVNRPGWNLYTDGSFTGESDSSDAVSGWGLVVITPDDTVTDYFGPTILDYTSREWYGARRHSNNVAELCAIYHALQFILARISVGSHVHVVYDSKYAAKCTQRLWRAQTNLRLVESCADLADRVDASYTLTWSWVRGHTRYQWNERADANAKLGASGQLAAW